VVEWLEEPRPRGGVRGGGEESRDVAFIERLQADALALQHGAAGPGGVVDHLRPVYRRAGQGRAGQGSTVPVSGSGATAGAGP